MNPQSYRLSRARVLRALQTAILTVALFSGAVANGAGTTRQDYDIPVGMADQSLKLFAEQSGHTFIADGELLRDVKTSAVKGTMSAQDAVDRLLAGTNLVVAVDSRSGAFVIRKASDPNAPRTARPEPSGSSATVPTDTNSLQDSSDEESVVVLSPFEVVSSTDSGYMASNTLAGTRLNSRLSDVAVAVSPFTRELIDDLGVDNIEGLLNYTNNSVRLDETELANGTANVEFGFQFTVRGLPASRSRDYFLWDDIETDNFNVERIDQSRGPNSILFGVGAAGGIINVTTKRPNFLNRSSAELLTASNQRVRASIDLNRVLVEDRLAIRLNLVSDQPNSWRYFEFSDEARAHLAMTYRITDSATLRVEGEHGDVRDNRSRSYVGDEHIQAWLAAGRPNRSVSTAGTLVFNNAFLHIDNDDTLTSINAGQQLSFETNAGAAFQEVVTSESEILSFVANAGGPDQFRETTYSTYSIYLEQSFGQRLNVEAAFNHQENEFLHYDAEDMGYDLKGDVSIAPGFTGHTGELFYSTNWARRTRDRSVDTFRLTGAYELEAGKRLGRHRFAAMFERRDMNTARTAEAEYLVDQNGTHFVPLQQGQGAVPLRNRLFRRHYVTEGDFSTYHVGSWRDDVSLAINGVTYTNAFTQLNSNIQDDRTVLDSRMVSMQNFWLNEKVVTTAGYRADDMSFRKRGVRQNPVTNYFEVDYTNPPTVTKHSGESITFGVVVKPTSWLSLLYNEAENRGLPDVNQSVLPNSSFAPPSVGEGRDIGLMLRLLDGRLFARVAWYENSMKGLTAFGNRGNLETPNFGILDALLAAGLISNAEHAQHAVITNVYTFGRESEGYEAQLTLSINDNWSLMANYSTTDRVAFNIMPEVLAWYAQEDAYWRSFGNAYFTVDPAGPRASIADESARILNNYILDRTRFEGIGDEGSRKEQANLFTNYHFKGGFLKGFNVGGGVRYLGPMAVSVDVANKSVLRGNSKTLWELLLGYQRKDVRLFGIDADLKCQLNVRNLFDNRDVTIAGMASDGRITRIRLETPREFAFRLTLGF